MATIRISPDFFTKEILNYSDWQSAFNEFFDSGLGFPGTDEYKEILRKHVGSDITDAVAIGY